MPSTLLITQERRRRVEFVFPRDTSISNRAVPFAFVKSTDSEVDERRLGRCDDDHDDGRHSTIDEILDKKKRSTKYADDPPDSILRNLGTGKLSGISVEDAVKDKSGCRPRANSTDGELNLPRRGLFDERIVLHSYRWSDWKQRAPKGFVNLGNTCFLNATLQCLAYIPPFCKCLISFDPPSGKLSPGQRISDHLRRLFRRVHDLDPVDTRETNGAAIAPRTIVKAVPALGSIGSRNGYKFRPGRQEDAHEFLVYLLDAMQDGELRAAGINQHAHGWRDRLPIPRLDETTFIHRVFGGYLRSQVCCTKCGYQSNTYDPFFDLSLEVSKKSSNSIASAFMEFSRKETLDKNNRWRCSGCKQDVCATKLLTVFRPPLSLCIQLKRFTFSNGHGFGGYNGYPSGMRFVGMGGGSKINKAIDFPAEFKLPLSDGRKCDYALTGIIVHLGSSATSGHYTAFVRKPGPKGSLQWFHMDDSFVEPVSEKTVLRQKDAYVLFYSRTEVKLELPVPPLRASMTADEAKRLNALRSKARLVSTSLQNEGSLPPPENSQHCKDISQSKGKRTASIPYEGTNPKCDAVVEMFSEHESLKNVNGDSVDKELIGCETLDGGALHDVEVAIPTALVNSPIVAKKTRVFLNRCTSQGKLVVMIGPRYKSRKAWKPTSRVISTSENHLSSWNRDSGDENRGFLTSDRDKVIKQVEEQDVNRKRRLQLDRWDSMLDQGKTKKVKSQKVETFRPTVDTKFNPFQKLQTGIQRSKSQHLQQIRKRSPPPENGKIKSSLKRHRKDRKKGT